jgi:hypothetical protein
MRRHTPRTIHRVGGTVTTTRLPDRTGEGEECYAISWHSSNGDLAWLSPKISSENEAQTAAEVLAGFAGATKR